jgi:hypothetical protein
MYWYFFGCHNTTTLTEVWELPVSIFQWSNTNLKTNLRWLICFDIGVISAEDGNGLFPKHCVVFCCDSEIINIIDKTYTKPLSQIYVIQLQAMFLSSVYIFDGQNKYGT